VPLDFVASELWKREIKMKNAECITGGQGSKDVVDETEVIKGVFEERWRPLEGGTSRTRNVKMYRPSDRSASSCSVLTVYK
jgi:hypothetical protein